VRDYRIAFANIDETPGVTLEGLGFTGLEVRRSFELAARTLPVKMLYYDNAGDPATAIANAIAAIAARVDLLIEYFADPDANAEIARHLAAAKIPALAWVHPVPGAPLYGPDNRVAGRIAGRALGKFAQENWAGEQVLGIVLGDVASSDPAIAERVQGITEGVHELLPTLELASLDTGGQSIRADALITKFLLTQRGRRLLIATLDDLAAVYAKNAIELNRRQSDCIIVSQGLDHNIHGGVSEKKEIDPNNRGSVVLGSVAYYMDRYGYDVLPLALRVLAGESLPAHTFTSHKLVTATDVFEEYPPFDIN
jgi:ribose transport system substrate-binding protein